MVSVRGGIFNSSFTTGRLVGDLGEDRNLGIGMVYYKDTVEWEGVC